MQIYRLFSLFCLGPFFNHECQQNPKVMIFFREKGVIKINNNKNEDKRYKTFNG